MKKEVGMWRRILTFFCLLLTVACGDKNQNAVQITAGTPIQQTPVVTINRMNTGFEVGNVAIFSVNILNPNADPITIGLGTFKIETDANTAVTNLSCNDPIVGSPLPVSLGSDGICVSAEFITPITIMGHASFAFELRGRVSNGNGLSGAFIRAQMLGDAVDSFGTRANVKQAGASFMWRDNSDVWHNGFGVTGLPSSDFVKSSTFSISSNPKGEKE